MSTRFHNGIAYEITGQGPDVVLIHGLGPEPAPVAVACSGIRNRLSRHYLRYSGAWRKPQPGRLRRNLRNIPINSRNCSSVCNSEKNRGYRIFTRRHDCQAFRAGLSRKLNALVIMNSAHGRTEQERAAVLKRVEQARERGPSATVEAALKRWFTPEYANRNLEMMNRIRQWGYGKQCGNLPGYLPHDGARGC